MARYGLAKHVFVCADEEYVVVLDVKQDRYFTLEAAKTVALSPLVPGWPATSAVDSSSDGAKLAAEEAAAPLVRQGWLLESPAPSKEATPVRPVPAQTELLADAMTESARIGVRAVANFVFASVFAKLSLRFLRFEKSIRRVAARRAAHSDSDGSLDIARARQLVDIFGRLRAFLFSHREECLHDSLALLEFLARYDVLPRWVFGVRARPFVAHCWVQCDDMVFNDTVEHVTSYTPIMVV